MKLENLATVMTLYSRRTFSKESFQWTKCVVKYLYDAYSHLSHNMLAFLVEVSGGDSIDTFFGFSYFDRAGRRRRAFVHTSYIRSGESSTTPLPYGMYEITVRNGSFDLLQVLERGPYVIQLPVLNIIHCMLHYVDLSSTTSQPFNADLLRVIAKYIEVTVIDRCGVRRNPRILTAAVVTFFRASTTRKR